VAPLWLATLACAPATRYHMPESARGYAVYVPGKDSLSVQLAQAFRRRGVVVLGRLRGGGGPTAAVVHFTFRDEGPEAGRSLHVQLADTRTGAIVAVAVLTLDSLAAGGASVEAILDSLGLPSSHSKP
jgi:hypothetical protein